MAVTNESVGYLLLIDGVPTAFATTEAIDADYVATIGEFTGVCSGLELPRGLGSALNLTTGTLSDTSATFKIEDIDDTLAVLFGSSVEDATELLGELLPGEIASPTEYGKHVGTELIGPAGERRRCSCVPGFNVGVHHFSGDQSLAFGLGHTPVSDNPVMWPGRRCALYRLVLQDNGTWPDLTLEASRASALCWFGSLLGQGTQDRRSWSLRCAGPESWTNGNLGVGLPKEPIGVEAELVLDGYKDEHILRASLSIYNPDSLAIAADFIGYSEALGVMVWPYEDSTTLTAGVSYTYSDLVAAFQSFFSDITAFHFMGAHAFEDFGFSDLRYGDDSGSDGIQVIWDRLAYENMFALAGGPWAVRFTVEASRKVWLALGYDPCSQVNTLDPEQNPELFGDFTLENTAKDRYYGRFWSANAVGMTAIVTNDFSVADDDYDMRNGGGPRRWPPIYPLGSQMFDMDRVGQVFRLTTEVLFVPGSKAVPLMADPSNLNLSTPYLLGGSAVTHVGVMAFRGPYRRSGDDDTFKTPDGYAFGVPKERSEGKTTQVARVAWRQYPDGSVVVDADNNPRFVIYEWLDPRLYGLDYDRIDGLWASWRVAPEGSEPMTARPLLVFERGGEGDCVPEILARILATTGTAGEWYTSDTLVTQAYGHHGTPVLAVGANDLGLAGVGDELLGRFTDAEQAGLGLAVPRSMIATSAATDQSSIEQALQELAADAVYRCKVVAGEPVSARKLIADLLAPTGLCMSLAGGKFGVFDPWTFRTAASTGNVTSEMYAGKVGDPNSVIPEQTLRKLSPIDRVDLQARLDVTTGNYARKASYVATDPGVQYRAQTITRSVNGAHMIHPLLAVLGASWQTSFMTRWDRGFRFWASSHYEIEFTVHASRAGEFWPGAIVSITDEWVVNPIGTYGVAMAPGFVTSRVLDGKAETAQVTCMVCAYPMAMYSPAAVLERYDDDEDGEGFRLFVKDDAFGFRGGASFDADGFIEPEWCHVGGDALIEGWAFDGVAWTRGIYGEVDSIDVSTPGSTFIRLTGALTGTTLRRDHWHVFVLGNAVEQTAAWVPVVYAPLCSKTGTSAGLAGKKWRG